MAEKSTFLRQNALIAILAHMDSFVPADSAHIGVNDKIFSRVGATDNITAGYSTFMVEMIETATIVNQATDRSLVILDEIGRGTGVYDGLSIAQASNLQGVNFVVANTDAEALEKSLCDKKIQLGINLTKGLGAGALPDVGKGAAEESMMR
ncbi:Uncharacterized protein BM_BM17225 [Brugia malayi]|uniref:DNA mismatch repair proteins mutS family domain-containing protein n=1 Tax=Brugia malayi TaxID=6279 RepID=A0A4E9FSH3_BRUMA|nr:Uncharacterized protein BM_BM17225 [Brugia malayi]VIP00380.1 Uncharacterized protein BM_BM17225 [Brugia malayi]